jgi:transglutaminase-like putative cysteine protease
MMQKTLSFCLLALWMFLLAGCSMEVKPAPKHAVSETPPEMVIVPDAMVACLIDVGQIKYVPDAKGTDVWQTPEQTASLGQGDCEDICIYLQHLLRRKGIEVDVVFGLKTRYHKHGHCWCEYEQNGETYVIEPRTNAFYHRSRLPSFLYVRADDVDVVEKKVRAYHDRTGVWVSKAYRKRIEGKKTLKE